LLSLLATDK
jgi:hypothetical protein